MCFTGSCNFLFSRTGLTVWRLEESSLQQQSSHSPGNVPNGWWSYTQWNPPEQRESEIQPDSQTEWLSYTIKPLRRANLSTKVKIPALNVSIIRRFHCMYPLYPSSFLDNYILPFLLSPMQGAIPAQITKNPLTVGVQFKNDVCSLVDLLRSQVKGTL